MVNQLTLASLLVLPTLALAAPHVHGHQHAHAKRNPQKYHTKYTTVQVVKTVWDGEQPAETPVANAYQPVQKETPTPSVEVPVVVSSPSVAAPSSVYVPPVVVPSSSSSSASLVLYSSSSAAAAQPTGSGSGTIALPEGTAGKVKFINNCDETVRISKVPPPACGSGETKELGKGEDWSDTFEECSAGNIALKIYKQGADDSKPVHYEYGLNNTQKMAWYNLSFVNCYNLANKDLKDCVGSGWGIGSCTSCQEYKCTQDDPQACCDEPNGGYCDPYATTAAQQPVGGCGEPDHLVPDLFINMALC